MGDDDRHHLPGGDVIAGHKRIEPVCGLESRADGFGGLEGESSAHVDLLSQRQNRGVWLPIPAMAWHREVVIGHDHAERAHWYLIVHSSYAQRLC